MEEVADLLTQQPTGSARPNKVTLKCEHYQIVTDKRWDCFLDFLCMSLRQVLTTYFKLNSGYFKILPTFCAEAPRGVMRIRDAL